jgi:hypothetical protein
MDKPSEGGFKTALGGESAGEGSLVNGLPKRVWVWLRLRLAALRAACLSTWDKNCQIWKHLKIFGIERVDSLNVIGLHGGHQL